MNKIWKLDAEKAIQFLAAIGVVMTPTQVVDAVRNGSRPKSVFASQWTKMIESCGSQTKSEIDAAHKAMCDADAKAKEGKHFGEVENTLLRFNQ